MGKANGPDLGKERMAPNRFKGQLDELPFLPGFGVIRLRSFDWDMSMGKTKIDIVDELSLCCLGHCMSRWEAINLVPIGEEKAEKQSGVSRTRIHILTNIQVFVEFLIQFL